MLRAWMAGARSAPRAWRPAMRVLSDMPRAELPKDTQLDADPDAEVGDEPPAEELESAPVALGADGVGPRPHGVPERLYRRSSNVVSLRFVLPFCNAADMRRILETDFPKRIFNIVESRTPHYNRTGRWFVEADTEETAREIVQAFHGRSVFGQRLHAWTVSPINLQSTTSRSVLPTENALLFWGPGPLDYKAVMRFFRGFKLKERYPISSLTPERVAYKVSFATQQEMFRALRDRNHRPLSPLSPSSPIVRLRIL